MLGSTICHAKRRRVTRAQLRHAFAVNQSLFSHSHPHFLNGDPNYAVYLVTSHGSTHASRSEIGFGNPDTLPGNHDAIVRILASTHLAAGRVCDCNWRTHDSNGHPRLFFAQECAKHRPWFRPGTSNTGLGQFPKVPTLPLNILVCVTQSLLIGSSYRHCIINFNSGPRAAPGSRAATGTSRNRTALHGCTHIIYLTLVS